VRFSETFAQQPRESADAVKQMANADVFIETVARLADMGATVFPGSPTDFGKFIAEETEKWAKVIGAAHIKVE
jgi:hypothetical protein